MSIPTAVFCMTVVCMQLIEFIVWSFPSKTVNLAASIAAATLLWVQPVASLFTLDVPEALMGVQAYGGLSLLALLLPHAQSLEQRYRMTKGPNGHLVWHWLDTSWSSVVSLVIYFAFLFGPLLWKQEWLLMAIAGTTLGLSLWSYSESNTWGSMWCWIVNFIVVGVSLRQVLVAKP